MDDDPSLIEHPVARVLLAVIPAALVFLFFLSVLVWVFFPIPPANPFPPGRRALGLFPFAYTLPVSRLGSLVFRWCSPWPKTAIVRRT